MLKRILTLGVTLISGAFALQLAVTSANADYRCNPRFPNCKYGTEGGRTNGSGIPKPKPTQTKSQQQH